MSRFKGRLSSVAAFLTFLALLGIFALFQLSNRNIPLEPSPTEFIEPALYSIFFTHPSDPKSLSLRGGPDEMIVNAIEEARFSIDVAAFELNLWSLRDALRDAHRRGLRVRFITDGDHLLEPEVHDLIFAGIPVVADEGEHFMHHKFIIVDAYEVWTGSMNFTINGAYRNHNNLFRIRSHALAASYTREFEEMFIEKRFGALSKKDTPHSVLHVNDQKIEVLFSPDDGVASRVLELLRSAEKRIDFMMYSLTLDDVGDLLLEKSTEGVAVRGVLDGGQVENQGSEYVKLRGNGLDVRVDTERGKMHHKIIIIDGAISILGSYNFSRNAEKHNDENVIIVYDKKIADQLLYEFESIYQMATP